MKQKRKIHGPIHLVVFYQSLDQIYDAVSQEIGNCKIDFYQILKILLPIILKSKFLTYGIT